MGQVINNVEPLHIVWCMCARAFSYENRTLFLAQFFGYSQITVSA
jgi:hypothetical protein